jgi:hypothetical protein
MLKMNTKRVVLIAVTLIVIISLFTFSYYIISTNNQSIDITKQLSLMCYIDIKSVDLQNHTAFATFNIEIYGIQNLTLAGASKAPNITCLQVSDSYNDELNCTLAHDYGNGTYSYEGTLQDKNWYLYSMGEGYPYDPNFIQFNVLHLDFIIDNTKYAANEFENYSFKFLNPQVKFVGQNYIDLTANWQIENRIKGETLDVMFNRNTMIASLIIIAPIAWLLIVVTMAPALIEDRKTKIEVYSAIVVFSPMFIFAIQTFLPPRSAPSIAEFLTVILLLLATSFLLTSLPKWDSKTSLKIDQWVFKLYIPIVAFMALISFMRVLSWSIGVDVVIGLLLVWLYIGKLIRVRVYDTQKRRKEEKERAQFQIV